MSSQSILSKVVERHLLNRTQYLLQQRDRSRFFYQLRQNKKKRCLQHGSIRHHQQHQYLKEINMYDHEKEKQKFALQKNDLIRERKKFITGIVGSSIARNISIKNIESETDEVRLRAKSGSDCAEVVTWLKSNDGQIFMKDIHQLIFIIGTNDVHRVGAHRTVQRIDHTIETIKNLYPNVNIVWQLLQRRTRKTWHLPEGQAVLNEIRLCNVQLLQLAEEKKFDTIQPDISINRMYDGLHPTPDGVKMMEITISNHLKRKQFVYSSSFQHIPPLFQSVYTPPSLMSINF